MSVEDTIKGVETEIRNAEVQLSFLNGSNSTEENNGDYTG